MVEVVVDTNNLRARKPGGNLTGPICLRVEADCFPDPQWDDFPVIILGWWIEGLLEVAYGRAKAFEGRFMDGPYSFVVERTNGISASVTLHEPNASRFQTVGLQALLASTAAAGAQVVHASKVNGWANADLTRLEALLARAAA
jgi:hypothetical protein